MEYIIVGSNNFWYETWETKKPLTQSEIKKELKAIQKRDRKEDFGTDCLDYCETYYLFEAKKIGSLNQ